MVTEISGQVLTVPLAPSTTGDPSRCRPIGCYIAGAFGDRIELHPGEAAVHCPGQSGFDQCAANTLASRCASDHEAAAGDVLARPGPVRVHVRGAQDLTAGSATRVRPGGATTHMDRASPSAMAGS